MDVRSLGNIDFDVIMKCFLTSFENYYVPMPTDYNYYKKRWQAAGVDYKLSFGMFDKDRLVTFIINAVDKRQGYHIAFNTGTGVLPEYRGQRIVKSIYKAAIPILVQKGITKCQLEVITENTKAVKAYESIGFNISRTLRCYGGEIATVNSAITLEDINFEDLNWEAIPNQNFYSWDFQRESLQKGNFKYYNVYSDNDLESFFSMNPENNTINQLEVFNDNSESWKNAFSAIQSKCKTARIINVDDRLKSKIAAIENAGLVNTVNQYEMELLLYN